MSSQLEFPLLSSERNGQIDYQNQASNAAILAVVKLAKLTQSQQCHKGEQKSSSRREMPQAVVVKEQEDAWHVELPGFCRTFESVLHFVDEVVNACQHESRGQDEVGQTPEIYCLFFPVDLKGNTWCTCAFQLQPFMLIIDPTTVLHIIF